MHEEVSARKRVSDLNIFAYISEHKICHISLNQKHSEKISVTVGCTPVI